MFNATLKSLLSRKLRLLLSGLAVVLGVMAVSGALILTDSLGRSFDALFQTVDNNIDVSVIAAPKVDSSQTGRIFALPIPASTVAEVAAVSGVKKAEGTVAADGARVIGPDGKVISLQGPPRLGVSWRSDSTLAQLRQGRGPQAADEVAINAALAKLGKFRVGSSIAVLTMQPKRTFTVVGIFGYGANRDSVGGETAVAFTEPVAQELMLGQPGVFSGIDVSAKDGISPEKLRDNIKAALGSGYKVRTGKQVAADDAAGLRQFLDIIRNFLLGFAGITLFVGVFLIINTFSILVAQRTRELALFRALGASRRQVLGSVLIEALVIGLIASTIGLVAGYGLAALLRRAFESFGGSNLPSAGFGVPITAIVAGYLVGLLVTALAALLPALRASRIPPVAAMRDAAIPDRPLTVLTVAGAIPTIVGAATVGLALFRDLGDNRLWALIGGVLLVFVGVAMLTPAISRPVVSVLGRALSWSVAGKLGRRNSARNPRRTAITAATLMIGIALVTGISVIASSLKASLDQLTSQDLHAQLIIAGDQTGGTIPSFDQSVIDQTRQIAGVSRAEPMLVDFGQIGATTTTPVEGGDGAALAEVFSLKTQSGTMRTLKSGEVAVDQNLAKARHLSVGSTVDLVTPRSGRQSFTVVAIYKASQFLPGPLISLDDARAGFISSRPTEGFVTVSEGASVERVQGQVSSLLKDNPEVSVRNQANFAAQQASQINSFQVILYILLALAIVIAILGIVNTLALSILERTRELGLLRAVGLLRAQVAQMVTVESVVISVFGALLGLVVGSALGAAVVRALRDQGIPVLRFSWGTIAVFLVLAVVVGLIAAIVPAIRAARTDVLKAIAYE